MNYAQWFASRFLVTAFLLGGTANADYSKLAGDLAQFWQTKPITLRVPDRSRRLRFKSEGQRVGAVEPGTWATDAVVQVETVEVREHKLEIVGKRMAVYFDPKQGKFDRAWTPIEVTISVELPDKEVTCEQFMPILDKIFLTGSQHVRDLAPPYWDTCLKGEIVRDEQTWKCQYRPDAPNSAIAGRYPSFRGRFIPANVKPPKPVRTTPEPQYTQIAQNLRMQGTTVLGLVVDTDGHPRDIQIISPVGLGLDDQAVRAVEQWRFKPATRDGVPIAVQIDVGVNFRLLPYQK